LKKVLLSPPEKKLNKDRRILPAAKCKPMILVSRNTRYMRRDIRKGSIREVASNKISVMPASILS